MARPVGVTLSAIVAILGSAVALLFGVVFIVTSGMTPPTTSPVLNYQAFAIMMGILVIGLGMLGITTAMGLLKLRRWARTSILVFAGFLVLACGLGALVIALVPIAPQPNVDAVSLATVRGVGVIVYAIPFLIGVWWLIQFNRKATKDAFVAASPDEVPGRPLAVSIVGWVSMIGGFFLIMMAIAGLPAFFAGFVFTGWAASLFYVFMGGVNSFLGFGLLKLDERARLAALGWYAFTAVHSVFVAVSPGARAKMFEMQALMRPADSPPPPFDQTAFTVGSMLFGTVIILAAIYFLVKERHAFTAPDSPGESA